MRFITKQELRKIGQESKPLYESASVVLSESVKTFDAKKTYDVFLSHSSKDAEVILGLKKYLEKYFQLTVYVDWIDDKQLDRKHVNRNTAETLRRRMRSCKSLIYAVSENAIGSNGSRWMPWELGYFDGLKRGKVAIMPIQDSSTEAFNGEEYLQLYELVGKPNSYSSDLKINNNDLKNWINY